jgi:hypothetical protein
MVIRFSFALGSNIMKKQSKIIKEKGSRKRAIIKKLARIITGFTGIKKLR